MVWYSKAFREYHGITITYVLKTIELALAKSITKVMLIQWYFFVTETNTSAYTEIIYIG